jgi:hypothetical protein
MDGSGLPLGSGVAVVWDESPLTEQERHATNMPQMFLAAQVDYPTTMDKLKPCPR